MMGEQRLSEILAATLDPGRQKEAAAQLDMMYRVAGFAPSLMRAVMDPALGLAVQQAAAVYFKNMVVRGWHSAKRQLEPGEIVDFSIQPADQQAVRAVLIDAAVQAPQLLRQQLLVCVKEVVKADFPERWPEVVSKLSFYLQQSDPRGWPGALAALYQLVKCYEFQETKERVPMVEAMAVLLPLLHRRLSETITDVSESVVNTQKLILKIYHSYVNYQLHVEQESFTQWMELFRRVAERAVPDEANSVDEEDRPALCWWKCRKWALHLLFRMFDRYGSPGLVLAKYELFARWYVKTFSTGTLKLLLDLLDAFRRGQYISPRVLQFTLKYIDRCVHVAFAWKLLRPHVLVVIKDVVFPLLCFNEKDAELWEEDPHEFIRVKYDPMEDFVSPVLAGCTLLNSVAKKRKDMLQQVMQFAAQALTSPDIQPQHKDGILHLVGSISRVLSSRPMYRDQMEAMLVQHVYPEFTSQHPYLRARACWMLQHFNQLSFHSDQNVMLAVSGVVHCLLNDDQLPVQVEASIALQNLLQTQPRAASFLQNNVEAVLVRVLDVIRKTDSQELTSVLQSIVGVYSQQLRPVALQLAGKVVEAFHDMALCTEQEADDKIPAAMGLINTMDLLVEVWEDDTVVAGQLEPLMLKVVVFVLENSIMDLYEDVFRLVASLTATRVSPDLWRVFEMLYKLFEEEGFEFFEELMPALHNFVTVDTAAFLAAEARVAAVFNMCKTVMTCEHDKLLECLAVKLVECVVLQCRGRISQYLPAFIQLVVERMMRELGSNDLRIMCLQALIAVLYTEPDFLLQSFGKTRLPTAGTTGDAAVTLTDQFISQWLADHHFFSGIHDRKMYVLGWCVLLLRVNDRPSIVDAEAPRILPALIIVLDGLRQQYEERNYDSDDGVDASAEERETSLHEDDAEEDMDEQQKTDNGTSTAPNDKRAQAADADEDSDSDSEWNCDDRCEEYSTPLDADDCTVDEFVVFSDTIRLLQHQQPGWYSTLTDRLNGQQLVALQQLLVLAAERGAAGAVPSQQPPAAVPSHNGNAQGAS